MTHNSTIRTWPRGTTEYLEYSITADVELDVQPVKFTFDRTTFIDAAWIGEAGTTRVCRALVDDESLPSGSAVEVFIQITDNHEIPLIPAGSLNII